jgi:predicted DNA-binding transcriptional regulator AlpA
MSQHLLTTRDVAELLGLSPEAVLRRWRAGQIPGFRLASNVLRFDATEIGAWLDSLRAGPRYSTAEQHQPEEAM